MNLPFGVEEFLQVFARYNQAIWPIQILAYALGISTFWIMFRGRRPASAPSFILAALWFWTGIVYHLVFFSSINPAAYLFGLLFIWQGALWLRTGFSKQGLVFRVRPTARSFVGLLLIAYALMIYPLFGIALGHTYPQMPMFGVTPCPLTIFTLGVLLSAEGDVPRAMWLIPVGWSLLGAAAAWLLGIWEDLGLLLAGLVSGFLLYRKPKTETHHAHPRPHSA